MIRRGQRSATVYVSTKRDNVREGREYFFLKIRSANGTTIRDNSGHAYINNRTTTVANPELRVSNGTTVYEGDRSRFTLNLNKAATQDTRVYYYTSNGTARSGSDYQGLNSSVLIKKGQSSAIINVKTLTDSVKEVEEDFFLKIRSAEGVVIKSNSGKGFIKDKTTPMPTNGFNIEFNFASSVSQSIKKYFETAALRWESVISNDYNGINDLVINVSTPYIDGVGRTLGRAGPKKLTNNTQLVTEGMMQFDSADVTNMVKNKTFNGVILHEMGHVLGLGTLWNYGIHKLKSDTYNYVGKHALAEYRTLSNKPTASSIPLERTGGSGTAGGHWSEKVFDNELMTGYANGTLAMSKMTIASLRDLGYTVDYSKADSYSLPSASTSFSLKNTEQPQGIMLRTTPIVAKNTSSLNVKTKNLVIQNFYASADKSNESLKKPEIQNISIASNSLSSKIINRGETNLVKKLNLLNKNKFDSTNSAAKHASLASV